MGKKGVRLLGDPEGQRRQKVTYHYTTPQAGSNVRVTLTLPTGLMVRGFCHTHPKSISTGNFGGDDFDSFKKVAKLKLDITFYLLNPQREIRYAHGWRLV
jgi:hypothetical protein